MELADCSGGLSLAARPRLAAGDVEGDGGWVGGGKGVEGGGAESCQQRAEIRWQ